MSDKERYADPVAVIREASEQILELLVECRQGIRVLWRAEVMARKDAPSEYDDPPPGSWGELLKRLDEALK